MKQVEAIIRSEKFPDVDRGLREIGGKWTFTHELDYETKISMVVEDKDVRRVVEAVVSNASTGSANDGKVLVIPVERAMDISPDDAYDEALAHLGSH